MDLYMKTVKTDICNITLLERCAPSIVRKWPTFLNHAVAQGLPCWEKYIDQNNYLDAVKMYTAEEQCDFVEWLMSRKYANKSLISRLIEHYSDSDYLKLMYCQEDDKESLSACINKDDKSTLSCYLEKTNPSFLELSNHLIDALSERSFGCTSYLASKIVTGTPVQPFHPRVWSALLTYNDHSIVTKLKEYLKITPINYFKSDEPRDIKNLLMGSREDVMSVLNSCQSNYEYPAAVASRLTQEPEYLWCLKEYIYGNNLLQDARFNTKMAYFILRSMRTPLDTCNLMVLLNKECLIFTGKHPLNISAISFMSWIAISRIDGDDVVNFSKCIFSGSPFKEYFDESNSSFYKHMFKRYCPSMPAECTTKLFNHLGSSATHWAYAQGLLKDIQCTATTATTAVDAAWYGNVFMLALTIEQLRREGTVLTAEDFLGKDVHQESVPFLACWFKSTDDQKAEFFSSGFGKYFYDTSSLSCNPTYSFPCRHSPDFIGDVFLESKTVQDIMEAPPTPEEEEMQLDIAEGCSCGMKKLELCDAKEEICSN